MRRFLNPISMFLSGLFLGAHHCVREKGLDTCADCAQMDVCQALGRITSNNPSAMENLKQLRRSKQDEAETA